jgi:hypothetical protein
VTRPNDDLQLLTLDDSKDPGQPIDGLSISSLGPDEVETQPRHAIGKRRDIVGPSNKIEYFSCK